MAKSLMGNESGNLGSCDDLILAGDNVVGTKSIGEVNDIYICRDLNSSGGILYTVIVVHDHDVVRTILEMFKMSDRRGEGILIEEFAQGDQEPYERERPASRIYTAANKSYQSIIKQLNDMIPKDEAPAGGFDVS